MSRKKIIESIKQEYLIRRAKAQDDCESFLQKIREDKVFDELYTSKNKTQFEILKAQLETEKSKLQAEVKNLNEQINNYLTKKNIKMEMLEPNYQCKKCNDTGVNNGKMCSCFLKELNDKITKEISCQTNFHSFNDCNLTLMDEQDIRTKNFLQTWANKYPDVSKLNISIIGGVGAGKTFLLECVAEQLIKNNIPVCFKTAFEVNELARLYHIGKSFDFTECVDAEVLLIDDLGTEPILRNVTKEYFYNLINTRQINKRPTIITTNLSFENILSRYDERIFSRLGNKHLSINIVLTSPDKRLS